MSLEIAKTFNGMMIAISDENWTIFPELTRGQLAEFLKQLDKNVVVSKYLRHRRGQKTPKPKRTKISEGGDQVSTAHLLASRPRSG